MANKKSVLIGICGGIASYKSCELVRLLVKNGHPVKVMMTEAATRFVSPLVFQELSRQPVYVDMFAPLEMPRLLIPKTKALTGFSLIKEADTRHISLAQWADLCVIAPLSANTLSKIANGICDNLVTTVVSALPKSTRILLAPAMNENMWKNPLIAGNVKKLSAVGGKSIKKYLIMTPRVGELACGDYGEGRMPEIKDIYKLIVQTLSKKDEG
jgi:phosphopantothenoylcysteine decarboxylase/phosphopantothenate--cysteine ligase